MRITLSDRIVARRAHGFTLLEVMIALAVVGIGLVAASSSIAQLTANGVYLRDKTLAHWIAMNKLAEMRLAESWPGTGTSDDDIDYAGQRWHWTAEVTPTDVTSLRRIDVSVARKDKNGRVLAKLAGFAGQPRTAAGLPTPWTGTIPGEQGGPGPGETPGNEEQPGDENGGDNGSDDESDDGGSGEDDSGDQEQSEP